MNSHAKWLLLSCILGALFGATIALVKGSRPEPRLQVIDKCTATYTTKSGNLRVITWNGSTCTADEAKEITIYLRDQQRWEIEQ